MTVHVPTQEEREEYKAALSEATTRELAVPVKYAPDGQKVIWEAQGSQDRFMRSPYFESLYHGTRGPGKTDALIMSFAKHVGVRHGEAWRGIIFRQTYKQLADVEAKTQKWFRQIFPGRCKFNKAKMQWEWSTGEALLLRHMMRPEDYWNYHGHEYPFIGWEELTQWSNDECYKSMMACCRSSQTGVPRMVRSTTNPYGVGHNWVKDRWQLYGKWWETILIEKPVDSAGRVERPRVAIHGHIDENLILLAADPHYKQTIVSSAANPAMAEAWLDGSWDIVAGGMFDDVWDARYNVVKKFDLPRSWYYNRSFDWGSSKPFSVGWWGESDGSDLRFVDGTVMSTVPGDIFRIKEWYGWSGQANQGVRMLATDIAAGIVERELLWKYRQGDQTIIKPGPADSSIFSVENGVSIGLDMGNAVRVGGQLYDGLAWAHADKRPGSRKNGWELLRKMIKAAHPNEGMPRETPGLFVVGEECDQFLRTFPSLPRSEKDMDDVDTDAEDHIGDEVRYRVRSAGMEAESGTHEGMW